MMDITDLDLTKLHVATVQDIHSFFEYLNAVLHVNFHPDDDFNDYVRTDCNEQSFTAAAAALLNEAVGKCFDLCEATPKEEGMESNVDRIYHIAIEHAPAYEPYEFGLRDYEG